jgi:hypothetical protein
MFSRLHIFSKAAFLCGVVILPACGAGSSSMPAVNAGSSSILHTSSGGKGGPGSSIPPPPQIDGPAWFLYNASGVAGGPASPNVNFDAIQNTVQGPISIGATRSATELVYNISKKTPLSLTQIVIVGTNASDFTIPASAIQLALKNPVPANRGQGAILPITFTPSAQGVRSGTLRIVSNAGTALVSLTGTALPPRPIIVTSTGPLNFLPASAPDTVTVSNNGGQGLLLQSIAITGAKPSSFQITVANSGQGNCFAGIELAAHSFCFIGVGLAPGAPAPSSATLAIVSNDPVHHETDIGLTLTP